MNNCPFCEGSIIARASSGSRSSVNSIEPLISANNAVTVCAHRRRARRLPAQASH